MASKDYPEDFIHENGNYQNKCITCNDIFNGHKRRYICKDCRLKNIEYEACVVEYGKAIRCVPTEYILAAGDKFYPLKTLNHLWFSAWRASKAQKPIRYEVIDHRSNAPEQGRLHREAFEISYQDDDKTLKIFLRDHVWIDEMKDISKEQVDKIISIVQKPEENEHRSKACSLDEHREKLPIESIIGEVHSVIKDYIWLNSTYADEKDEVGINENYKAIYNTLKKSESVITNLKNNLRISIEQNEKLTEELRKKQ